MQGCWDAPNASIGQLVRRTETRLKPAVHFASGSPAAMQPPSRQTGEDQRLSAGKWYNQGVSAGERGSASLGGFDLK